MNDTLSLLRDSVHHAVNLPAQLFAPLCVVPVFFLGLVHVWLPPPTGCDRPSNREAPEEILWSCAIMTACSSWSCDGWFKKYMMTMELYCKKWVRYFSLQRSERAEGQRVSEKSLALTICWRHNRKNTASLQAKRRKWRDTGNPFTCEKSSGLGRSSKEEEAAYAHRRKACKHRIWLYGLKAMKEGVDLLQSERRLSDYVVQRRHSGNSVISARWVRFCCRVRRSSRHGGIW